LFSAILFGMEAKQCKRCGETKTLSDFYPQKSTNNGKVYYSPYCKGCHNKWRNEKKAASKTATPKPETKTKAEKQQVCVECGKPGLLRTHPECRETRRARQARDRLKRLKQEAGITAADLNRKYWAGKFGLTVETYVQLMKAPCDVCQEEAPEHRKHNSPYARKDTGAVTGTVCQKCATALGFFKHNPERLRAALDLLTSDTDQRETT
jgi:hypothetical protein